MNFSPYVDGQDPNLGTNITEAQLTARLQIIANHTVWARSFGCTHGLEKFGSVAHSLGLKAAVGAWLSSNTSANNQEIANLIAAANAGDVDIAIVGSEVLLRNDLSETQLIAYINQVRQQIPANIPVAAADVYGKLLEHPAVIAAGDIVLPNYYPYWEGVSIETSIATLHRQHQLVVAAAQGKPVIVSETGWPSAGNVICNATPSTANASLYFLNFVSWARANNVPYFYFTSLDETWKTNYEGPQGAHWGVWDKDGVLKSGMQAVFDGQTMADNWTNAGVPGGPGTPSMEFAYVPPYGFSNNLFGQVFHVNTDDYKVAVYIYVGGWWTKPTFANPLTNIGLDGSWECDITTGGNDPLATQIVAYLVPKTFNPPPMSGGQTLPPSLDQNAVAKTEISRPANSPYVAGQVTDSNNKGLNCVTISLTGSQTATTHTFGNGNYSFLNLTPGGNYTVTPSHPSYTFNPLSSSFNNLAGSQAANFVALPNYSIALSASPATGGSVSGAGTFAAGVSTAVNATPNQGFAFANWSENGNVVSSSASYTFVVNSSRTLVAHFTPTTAPAQITSPVNGMTFSSGTVPFNWNPGAGASAYFLYVGNSLQGYDIYNNYATGGSTTVSGIPTDGRTIYVTMLSLISGTWQSVNYTYYAANIDTARITSPANGATFVSGTVTFNWNPGAGASSYFLYVGNNFQGSDIYNNYVTGGSTTVSGIPTDGRTIYVTMLSLIGGVWQQVNYTYHAASGAGRITSPVDGSTFSSGTVTFKWSAGTAASSYFLYVGNTFQGYDIYNNIVTGGTTTVSGIPTDGRTIYVTMLSLINGVWRPVNYTYHAASGGGGITSPSDGATFSSGTVTFNWSAGTGASSYYLYVGNSFQGYDIYNNYATGGSTTVSGIPTDGRTIYVTMLSLVNGVWQRVNYTYCAANIDTARIVSPVNGATFSSGTVTFNWNPGAGASSYFMYVGNSFQGFDIYNNYVTGGSTTVTGIPTDGRTIYVTMLSLIGGVWQQVNYTYHAKSGGPTQAQLDSLINYRLSARAFLHPPGPAWDLSSLANWRSE